MRDDATPSLYVGPPSSRGTPTGKGGSLHWPQTVAITLMFGLIALLASGWVEPMVPWAR